VVLVLPGIVGAGAPATAGKPATHTVTIDATRFQPDVLTVRAGDTIVWVNKDFFPHTATSKAGGFDSGAIVTDKSWTYVAKQKGEFPYICTFHPTTMKGTLRVVK
jgi:plastocyanin